LEPETFAGHLEASLLIFRWTVEDVFVHALDVIMSHCASGRTVAECAFVLLANRSSAAFQPSFKAGRRNAANFNAWQLADHLCDHSALILFLFLQGNRHAEDEIALYNPSTKTQKVGTLRLSYVAEVSHYLSNLDWRA
jgi:hypothetical protein